MAVIDGLWTLVALIIPGVLAAEVCQFENLPAECESGKVVVMETSLYGRMKAGRCINQDFGYVGCHKDVLSITHRRCSGKQTCTLKLPDEEMESGPWPTNQQCPEDLKKYLSANFSCQKVIQPKMVCSGNQRVNLFGGKGNISSYVSRRTQCGSTNSPFVIKGITGQQVRLGVVDFASEQTDLSIGDTLALPSSRDSANNCRLGPVYAILKDTVAMESHTICGGNSPAGQYREVLVSKGHQIEVRILGRDDENAKEFLLSFEVIGCADISVGTAGTWTRHGNEATYQCSEDGPKFKIRCQGSKWIGKQENCLAAVVKPAQESVKEGSTAFGFFTMTIELAIVVVCAIAFVVGVFIVVVGIFVLRRRQITEVRKRTTQYYQQPMCPGTAVKEGVSSGPPQHKTSTLNYSRQPLSPGNGQGREHHEHDYAYVDEHIISGIHRPSTSAAPAPRPVVPPPLPAHASFVAPSTMESGSLPQQQDTVSLPDFEYLAHGYNTLDSRNWSALERESKRNRGHFEDNNNEARYS